MFDVSALSSILLQFVPLGRIPCRGFIGRKLCPEYFSASREKHSAPVWSREERGTDVHGCFLKGSKNRVVPSGLESINQLKIQCGWKEETQVIPGFAMLQPLQISSRINGDALLNLSSPRWGSTPGSKIATVKRRTDAATRLTVGGEWALPRFQVCFSFRGECGPQIFGSESFGISCGKATRSEITWAGLVSYNS